MTNPLEPRKDPKSPTGISNFIRRIRGMPIFIGNFTYALDFMIVEDISSVIDPRMSPVVLGKPFVEISNMTYDLSLGVVKAALETRSRNYQTGLDESGSSGDMNNEGGGHVRFDEEKPESS
ncbi:hypothetical protein Tco_0824034 [Tanacetum coccineum]|uniref:Uncharacterized protein n=1 Tax=Tanacetum coccineum TaxID=301880 RepID=A0ABQ5AJQ1_9ASTR